MKLSIFFKHKTYALMNIMSIIIYLILFFIAISYSSNIFNPDAVSYYRLGQYWFSGNFDLAVSGYWGPMLSWIIAAIETDLSDPGMAGRLAIGISGLVFTACSLFLFSTLHLSGWGRLLATISVAALAARWATVGPVTPDLLMNGFLIFAVAALINALQNKRTWMAWIAGFAIGGAYLCKTPGMPLGLGMVFVITFIAVVWDKLDWHSIRKALAPVLLGAGVVVIPWVAVLSIHYDEFTWTTAGSRAQLVTMGSFHPNFEFFHHPREGRITSWEEPTELDYPTEIEPSLIDYIKIIDKNVHSIGESFSSFDLFGIIFASSFISFLSYRPKNSFMFKEPWRMAFPIAIVFIPPYLISYAYLPRYFIGAHAIALAGAIGLIYCLSKNWTTPENNPRKWLNKTIIAGFVIFLSFSILYPIQNDYRKVFDATNQENSFYAAKLTSSALEENNLSGSIATIGEDIASFGLYISFLTNEKYLGHQNKIKKSTEIFNISPKYLIVDKGHNSIPSLILEEKLVDRTDLFLPSKNHYLKDKIVAFEVLQ